MTTLKLKHVVIALLLVFINIGGAFAQTQLPPQGQRIPRLTTAQRNDINVIPGQAQGQLIFNTDENCLEYRDSTKWVQLLPKGNPATGDTVLVWRDGAWTPGKMPAGGAAAPEFKMSSEIQAHYTYVDEDFLRLSPPPATTINLILPTDASVPVGKVVYLSNSGAGLVVFRDSSNTVINTRNGMYNGVDPGFGMIIIYLGDGVWDSVTGW